MDVLILRDPRESPAKCSLTPLRGLAGIDLRTWRFDRRYAVGGRVLLHPEGEPLSAGDAGRGLLLLDCAWRRLPRMQASLDGQLHLRRLPPLRTAYPRRSKLFVDPAAGLASVEALYAALALLGERRAELLADYRWREDFLRLNPELA
jgi:pre-rRNA-processing protein TSR3